MLSEEVGYLFSLVNLTFTLGSSKFCFVSKVAADYCILGLWKENLYSD
jgi:hypothetical protein